MNNNNLDQITMRSSKRRRKKIPQKFTNDTSMGIGEIQPLMVKKVLANTKTRVRVGNVIRLEPMVAPTFGQLKLHHNFAFVGMSDLLDSAIYNAYQVQKPVAFSSGLVQIPKQLPQVSLRVLSAFALAGAKVSVYQARDNHTDTNGDIELRRFYYNPGSRQGDTQTHFSSPRWVGSDANSAENFLLHIGGYSASGMSSQDIENALYTANRLWMKTSAGAGLFGEGAAFEGYQAPVLNVGRILGFESPLWLPSADYEMPLMLQPAPLDDDVNEFIRQTAGFKPGLIDLTPVTYEDYDFEIHTRMPYGTGTDEISAIFLVRLSDFGIRWYKMMLACKVGFDLQSVKPVDMTRFAAVYKAWFDSFGITQYQGWETSCISRFLAAYNSNYRWDYTDLIENEHEVVSDADMNDYKVFFKCLREMCDMWYTEEQDFVTAHSRQAAVSDSGDISQEFLLSGTPNVNGAGLNIEDGSIDDEMADGIHDDWSQNKGGHAYISKVLHSQLDSEVLKRLYKVTNRNTIAGRRIAALLKAQGLGEYLKQCRSQFLGHTAVDIEIFDVTATADSSNEPDNVSSILGEYVGKGVGEGNSKWFDYTAAEVGYIIDLGAIVPESGWLNGVDLTAFDVRSGQQYQPEYDGLGLEISPKSIVTGVQDSFSCVPATDQKTMNEESYGFIPRYTRYKVEQNIANGSFSLRSVRRSFLPFTLDKFVNVGNRVTKFKWVENNSSKNWAWNLEAKLLTAIRVPIASPVYRYLGRYPWMSQFMRIFANIGRDANVEEPYWYEDYDSEKGESEVSWFIKRTDDPFNVHNVFLVDYWAPVLPIEDSFETHEDGNNGVTDMALGKS